LNEIDFKLGSIGIVCPADEDP